MFLNPFPNPRHLRLRSSASFSLTKSTAPHDGSKPCSVESQRAHDITQVSKILFDIQHDFLSSCIESETHSFGSHSHFDSHIL